MNKILTIILLLICTLSGAQNIKKGFKNLEKKEYDKAKESFAKAVSEDRDNIGANFGMALVLADEQSPLFDVIDSWQYIERIQGKTDNLSQEDIEIIGEYFLNTEVRRTSRPVKKKIGIAVDAIEARLIKYVREENNLDAVYEVLDRYPDFRHYDNVIHIRNQFEFRKYEKMNTLQGYREFIEKFPDAAQIEKAQKYINKLAFDDAKSKNTVTAFNSYIAAYPESEFVQSAIKLRNAAAYAEVSRINTLQAYENFIDAYPDALEVSEAKTRQQQLLYEKAKRIKSIDAYNEFIKMYPDGRYFVDIFNLKASEIGQKFVVENAFSNPAMLWSKGFDNNNRIESAGAVAATPDGGYVIACNTRDNDTTYSDTWVIKLDASGKMLWNKTVGQLYEDSISSLLVDSKGDIIALGYTYLSADSGSWAGWMYKLGSDGKKLWNRNLGKLKINACAISPDDKIYIGGSVQTDTTAGKYAVTIFNTDAKKVSQRIYTGQGSVNDIEITNNGNILMAGSNWITMLDNKRYLIWENTVPEKLTSTSCAVSPSGESYITGYNNGTIFYAKYSLSGNKIWFQDYEKSEMTQTISDICSLQSNLLVMENKTGGIKIKTFSANGNMMGVKEISGNIESLKALSDIKGTVLLFTYRNDIIVVRYSPISSL
ncbi:MAG: hypothetical protein JW894_07180 [Bacteroidales bacterium]|nr:hypothetical protein [Bacteroidales bacterium]